MGLRPTKGDEDAVGTVRHFLRLSAASSTGRYAMISLTVPLLDSIGPRSARSNGLKLARFWRPGGRAQRAPRTRPSAPQLSRKPTSRLSMGEAPVRPYHPYYHPRVWRGWFDFGTGALGEMAVHNLDPAFYALDLDAPVAAESKSSPIKKESYGS